MLAAFSADVRRIFAAALADVRAGTGSRSAREANGKFEGFEGSFATLEDFHRGAEASLLLGYPNPDIERGIRLEHTAHVSVARLFVTPNYRIATCLLVEYWWAVDPDAPSRQALDLLNRLWADRGADDGCAQGAAESGLVGPAAAGENGLSLVRGDSNEVDIDVQARTVTFRYLASGALLTKPPSPLLARFVPYN